MEALFKTVPYAASSALTHVSIAAWARVETDDARMESGATRTIPGMIFLSVDDLTTPWRVAEAILHEATHEKLFDLYLTASVLGPEYNALTSPRIKVPWNESHELQSNEWPVDQALAALHVYAHLAVFAKASAGLNNAASDLEERSIYRGSFLAEHLAEYADSTLGASGRRLIQWCCDFLERVGIVGRSAQDLNQAQRFLETGPCGGLAWSPTARKILVLGPALMSAIEGDSTELPSHLAESAASLGLVGAR